MFFNGFLSFISRLFTVLVPSPPPIIALPPITPVGPCHPIGVAIVAEELEAVFRKRRSNRSRSRMY